MFACEGARGPWFADQLEPSAEQPRQSCLGFGTVSGPLSIGRSLCTVVPGGILCVPICVCVCVFLGLLGLALVQVLEMTGTTGRRLTWINLQKTQMGEKGAVALAQVRHLVMFGA